MLSVLMQQWPRYAATRYRSASAQTRAPCSNTEPKLAKIIFEKFTLGLLTLKNNEGAVIIDLQNKLEFLIISSLLGD